MKRSSVWALIVIASFLLTASVAAQSGLVTGRAAQTPQGAIASWPTLAQQLDGVTPGSALEALIRANQDFSMLRPEEAKDTLRLPPWLRVYWRKAHPEGNYSATDPTGGYPLVLKEIYEWMMTHQDLQPGKPEPFVAPSSSPDATVSQEVRTSGLQTVARSESDVRINFLNPQQIVIGSNNIGGSGAQAQYFSSDGGATWGQG